MNVEAFALPVPIRGDLAVSPWRTIASPRPAGILSARAVEAFCQSLRVMRINAGASFAHALIISQKYGY